MKTLPMMMSVFLLGGLLGSPGTAQEEGADAPEQAMEANGDETPSALDPMEPEAETAPEARSQQSVILMDAAWASLACDAWNANPTLTDELAAPGWAANNKDRGYKVIQLYRTDCESSAWVELHIADQDGKALCTYGGAVKTEELISGVDYIMHALTQRWQEMGAGNYGPMKGMMTGRLKFTGPKWEAMKNMGPFASFLQLAGAVPSDVATCPPS